MHPIQSALLKLAHEKELGKMTLREIGSEIHEKFPQKVKHHLNQLQKRGLIKVDKQKRTIQPVERGREKSTHLYAIPVLGFANAGEATRIAEENIEGYLKVSEKLLPRQKSDLFAVRIFGSSMNRANIQGDNIEEGDYVIVDANQRAPESESYILSVIDGAANVKKFIKEPNRIILLSESKQEFPPIVIHPDDIESYNYVINGTVVSVVKMPNSY